MLRRSTWSLSARVAGLTLAGSLVLSAPAPGAPGTPASPPAADPAQTALPASRTVELTTTVRLPPRDRPARVWVPVPLHSPVQEIIRLTVKSPLTWSLEREPAHGNRFVYVEVPPSAEPTTLRWTAAITRHEWRGPHAEETPPAQLDIYTQPTLLVPTDGTVIGARTRQVIAQAGPGQRAQADALFEHVRTHMAYDKSGTGWGRGDAVYACTVGTGNCTDFHSLFNGMARAAGIPARFTMGLSLPPDASGRIPGYHCWTAYWLEGQGWVPADISEADTHPDRPTSDYHGRLDAHRIAISRGRDITLAPPQAGPPLNYVWDAYVEIGGAPVNIARTERTYRDLPAS